ncbi:hypothetical protein D3C87_1692110 [compost metagenome]
MGFYQVEGGEIADALVKLGRAAQVGEQECEAGDLQTLVDVDRIGAIDVAECLVGEQPLGCQKGAPAPEQRMQRLTGDADARQGAHFRVVFHLDAQRARLQTDGLAVPVRAVEHQ